MDVRFYEPRGDRIGAALGREDRRAVQFMQDPARGDDCLRHARDMPVHGGHVDLDRGLRPRGGRHRIVRHARNGGDRRRLCALRALHGHLVPEHITQRQQRRRIARVLLARDYSRIRLWLVPHRVLLVRVGFLGRTKELEGRCTVGSGRSAKRRHRVLARCHGWASRL